MEIEEAASGAWGEESEISQNCILCLLSCENGSTTP